MSHKQQSYNVSKADKVVETLYQFPQKPEPISCAQFVYNSKEGTFLGRTPKNWAKLTLFYIIFYIVLASMFAIFLQGLFATLSDDYPKWQLDSSIIGTNPGMSFRPFKEADERSTIINYKASSEKDLTEWVDAVNVFLEPYRNNTPPIKTKRTPCHFEKPPKSDEVCNFELGPKWGDCSDDTSFGYKTSAPCVFLKLNKIYGWVPQYYNNKDELHADMPADLVTYIKQINDTTQLNQIWVSCAGRKEGTVREILYVGSRGFPGYYYPFMNQDGYKSPLVPVQIRLQPNATNVIKIECRAWAKNILYNGSLRDRQGSVLIDLTIEK